MAAGLAAPAGSSPSRVCLIDERPVRQRLGRNSGMSVAQGVGRQVEVGKIFALLDHVERARSTLGTLKTYVGIQVKAEKSRM